jgi:hypothetical protein
VLADTGIAAPEVFNDVLHSCVHPDTARVRIAQRESPDRFDVPKHRD